MSEIETLLSLSEEMRRNFREFDSQLAQHNQRVALIEQSNKANEEQFRDLWSIINGRGGLPLTERVTRLEDRTAQNGDSIKRQLDEHQQQLNKNLNDTLNSIGKIETRFAKLEDQAQGLTWKLVGLLFGIITSFAAWWINLVTKK